ncbi:MAG: DUF3137 domain-containing protein [Roseivirga sp.]|nr:DUF3137 domain-containing protein [Roseivirga sp.]
MGLLRDVFGPSQNEIWSQIANEIGGELIDGGFWDKDMLEFRHKQWAIVLDTYKSPGSNHSTSTYTRMRVPFVNTTNFYFNIYQENFFSSIGKLLGMQDIIIGDRFFDDQFVIKSNSDVTIKRLLDSDKLKQLISSIPRIKFCIRDDDGRIFKSGFPAGVDILYFEYLGVIRDKQTLLNLFLLFSAVLERLVQIDSAYEDDPGIGLR